jgi:putative addiction module antidote
MITQKLRKVGNSYVVTIPKEEIERRHLVEGQLLIVEIQPVEVRPVLSEDVRAAFDRSWQQHEDAYRYLAEH